MSLCLGLQSWSLLTGTSLKPMEGSGTNLASFLSSSSFWRFYWSDLDWLLSWPQSQTAFQMEFGRAPLCHWPSELPWPLNTPQHWSLWIVAWGYRSNTPGKESNCTQHLHPPVQWRASELCLSPWGPYKALRFQTDTAASSHLWSAFLLKTAYSPLGLQWWWL